VDWKLYNLVIEVKDATQKKVALRLAKQFHVGQRQPWPVSSNWFWVVLPNNEGILKADSGWAKDISGNMVQLFATGESTWLLQLQGCSPPASTSPWGGTSIRPRWGKVVRESLPRW
jgi:hypothetical protein